MRILAIAIALALFAVTSVLAQEQTKITMKTFSVVSSFAPPPWANGPDVVAVSELHQNQGTTPTGGIFFIWEAIPKGEKFEDWTTLYAVTAETPLNGDVTAYMNGQINLFSEACTDVAVQISNSTLPNQEIFLIFCESYKDRPELGEVAFFNMQLVNQTLVKNYLHYRRQSFSIQDASEPPFPLEQMRDAIYRVGQLRIVPASN
ncbi:MAG: hypothetical protein AAF940_03040 [Pseudomonadota bacterium]